jgi:hypothetical protein
VFNGLLPGMVPLCFQQNCIYQQSAIFLTVKLAPVSIIKRHLFVKNWLFNHQEIVTLQLPFVKSMQKKDFVYLSEYTSVMLTLPDANPCKPQQVDTAAQPFFFSHPADAETIMATGRAYRKEHPIENNKNKLTALLLANSKLSVTANSEHIRDMLVDKVKNDFKTGKTAMVLGWVLSVTEARECALFSLLQS